MAQKNRKQRAGTPAAKPAAAPKPEPFKFASAGRYTTINENGSINTNMAALSRVSASRGRSKTASLLQDGNLGPANIADSNNIGYYSYQFPVDALEMPASRAEELEFFRLAYTRDPIVARAIDLHTEIPLSKMKLEKPKSSVDTFSDYVFDYFQRMVNDTRMFSAIIQATREYHTIGEAYLMIVQPEGFMELELSPVTAKAIKKGRGFQAGTSPLTEAANGGNPGETSNILPDFISSRGKTASLDFKRKVQAHEVEFADAGVKWDEKEEPDDVHRIIVKRRAKLSKLLKQQTRAVKIASLAKEKIAIAIKAEQDLIEKHAQALAEETLSKRAGLKLAAPGDEAPAPDAGAPADAGGDLGGDPGDAPADAGGEIPAEGGEGDLGGELGDDPGMGGGLDDLGGGGGGGGFGGGGIPADMADQANDLVEGVQNAKRDREINDLKRYIHLLERKKDLLEELSDLAEQRRLEKEIFSHVVNEDYEGFEEIQILQPERITITNDQGGAPRITYKPMDEEKADYLADPDLADDVKAVLEEEGVLPLNTNPFLGSYVLHFARKKSGYELHGRSALQSCMRAIIYREKLRQVQTTLASRNMTPKVLITAPGVSEIQIAELRAHADEAISDPDYVIVTNYEVTWNQIDSQSRLLNLNDEWQHTNSNLAIGLGFSPEILIGEGMYGNNRTQLDLMSTTYMQFREELQDLLENQIFKQIAMLKGFYETDNYGRPRWIFPRITFGALALRDSGDLYEMLFNMYARGSLPVSSIYEMLGLDAETVRRDLENDLFTINDAKFGDAISNLYNSIGQELVTKTDVVNRLAKNMNLNENMDPTDSGIEGSGEGM